MLCVTVSVTMNEIYTKSVMSKQKNTETVNFAQLRKDAGLTLAQLAELSGFGVATINGLEKRGEGSERLRKKIMEILLVSEEEGQSSEIRFWKERAKEYEKKLEIVRAALEGVLKKI